MTQLPTCLDINAECDNEPCMFHHDHKCTFHCRQWRHVNTGYQNQSERDKVLDEIFPKNPDVLHTGWVYKKELRERLEFRIMERNEWGLGEEEIEEVLMVFEEQLRQSKQDGDREP